MEHTFKVGDRVEVVELYAGDSERGIAVGGLYTVVGHDHSGKPEIDAPIGGKRFMGNEQIKLATGKAITAVTKFILQYKLDKETKEIFSTLSEVKDRIKVLAARTDLKRDSLVFYHVSKTEKVELSTAITFRSVEPVAEISKQPGTSTKRTRNAA